jgi:hypothetical protein
MDEGTLAAIVMLHRDQEHQRWAIWPPLSAGGQWTAVRPAGSRVPGPESPLVWVQAMSAEALGQRMRNANDALKPGG